MVCWLDVVVGVIRLIQLCCLKDTGAYPESRQSWSSTPLFAKSVLVALFLFSKKTWFVVSKNNKLKKLTVISDWTAQLFVTRNCCEDTKQTDKNRLFVCLFKIIYFQV